MPFVPAPNTALIEVVYEWDGQVVENTLYYEKNTTPILTDLAALTDAVRAYIIDQVLPALAATIQLVRVVGTLLDTIDGLQAFSTTDLPMSGSGGASVPNNVSICVSLKSANRGRSARGRNFIPGLPTAGFVESEMTPTLRAAFQTAWNGLITVAAEDGWTQVVCSRFSGFTIVDGKKVPTPRPEAVNYAIVSAQIIDDVADSQRRRLPGRGT